MNLSAPGAPKKKKNRASKRAAPATSTAGRVLFPDKKAKTTTTTTDNELFAVQAVRAVRTRNGKFQYLLKWEGHNGECNTWEPASNLKVGAKEIVASYDCNAKYRWEYCLAFGAKWTEFDDQKAIEQFFLSWCADKQGDTLVIEEKGCTKTKINFAANAMFMNGDRYRMRRVPASST